MTPLYAAAIFGHLDLVRYFIVSKGADVNQTDKAKGMVPLHGAALKGNIDSHGISYSAQDPMLTRQDNTGMDTVQCCRSIWSS